MVCYLIISFLFALLAIKSFRYSYYSISKWSYIRIILFSPLLFPIQVYNLLWITWFWKSKKHGIKDKSLKKAVSFIHSKLQYWFDVDFLFNKHRNSLSRAIYRYLVINLNPCCVGSLAYNIDAILKNLKLLTPWNRWANFVGQRFIYCGDTKLLTNSSCRTRSDGICYFTYKVSFGKLTITKTVYFNEKGESRNTYFNMFTGEVLSAKSFNIYEGYIFTRNQANKTLRNLLMINPNNIFNSFSFSEQEYLLWNLAAIYIKLSNREAYNIPSFVFDNIKPLNIFLLKTLYMYAKEEKLPKKVKDAINTIFELDNLKLSSSKKVIVQNLETILDNPLPQDFYICYNNIYLR